MAAASWGPTPPRTRISLFISLDQFDEGPGQFLRMDEGDLGSPPTDTGGFVHETDPFAPQMVESVLDRGHRVGDMVKTRPVPGKKTPHRRVRAERSNELHERPAERDHCFLDTLFLDDLAEEWLHVVLTPVLGDRLVEVRHGNCNMIEID